MDNIILNISNPTNPLSPANPLNPASPLNKTIVEQGQENNPITFGGYLAIAIMLSLLLLLVFMKLIDKAFDLAEKRREAKRLS